MEAITFNAQGIKCDNPKCGWRDVDAAFDMDKFHNAPCPKCGENLLTDADYASLKFMMDMATVVNKHTKPKPDEVRLALEIKMDGTGQIKLGDVEIQSHPTETK